MGNKATEIQAKYDAANTKQYKLKLNLNTDADIIKRLDSVPNRQGYIKDCIRNDIKASEVAVIRVGGSSA